MAETLAHGYFSDSNQRELPFEYPHDLVRRIFIIFCTRVHWTKVASSLEGLRGKHSPLSINHFTVVMYHEAYLLIGVQIYAPVHPCGNNRRCIVPIVLHRIFISTCQDSAHYRYIDEFLRRSSGTP